MDGEAGSVEAVLEAGERLIAVLEGLGGCVIIVGVVPAGFPGGVFPEIGIGAVPATQGPLAEDEVVEEEASLRGSGTVVVVILGFEPIEGLGFFPGQNFSEALSFLYTAYTSAERPYQLCRAEFMQPCRKLTKRLIPPSVADVAVERFVS